MTPSLYDAHNHAQDERFGGRQNEILAACRAVGVVRMVVNGTCEDDWGPVLELAHTARPLVIPSFGLHPWHAPFRRPDWDKRLASLLDRTPSGVGEIGLDRWKAGLPYEEQEEVFLSQLRMAAERNVPASIHCLSCWGRLYELLKAAPRPACGFLLHSYGGSREGVRPLADLGAYFSFSGGCAQERRARQREVFKFVPLERFLLETDAPDQRLPRHMDGYLLRDHRGSAEVNHPANLATVQAFAAEVLGLPPGTLAKRLEENFQSLFGGIIPRSGERSV